MARVVPRARLRAAAARMRTTTSVLACRAAAMAVAPPAATRPAAEVWVRPDQSCAGLPLTSRPPLALIYMPASTLPTPPATEAAQ